MFPYLICDAPNIVYVFPKNYSKIQIIKTNQMSTNNSRFSHSSRSFQSTGFSTETCVPFCVV